MADPLFDPYSQVYNALWTMVERSTKLKQYIPLGNRIKYEDISDVKESIQDADMPELALISGGGNFGNADNSTQRSCAREYIWALTSGDLRVNYLLNPIQFEIFRCMVDWECVLCNLQWCNCRFVTKCKLVSAEDGLLMQELNRAIPGWSSLWTVQVDFQFPIANLRIKE